MGSFNKQGFISSLPICSGDAATLIFLKPNKYCDSKQGGVVYSTDWYEPVFLPVFGEYDDYGRIENIKRTDSVKFIEDYFGLDIKSIIDEVDDNGVGRHGGTITCTKNEELYEKLTFALEHTSVYEKMASRKRLYYTEGYVVEYFLNKFGFFKIEDNSDTRYKNTWIHTDLPGYEYHSDGQWGHLVDSNGKKVDYIYHVDDMERELLKLNPNFKSNLTDEDRNICSVDLSIECTKLAIQKNEDEKTDDIKLERMRMLWGIEKYQGVPNITEYSSRLLLDGRSYSHDSSGQPTELLKTVNGKEIGDMIRFNWSISDLSAKYQPSNYGSQDESIMLHYEMLKCYREVIKNKLIDRLDYMDQDEVDEYEEIFAEIKADDRADVIDLVLG